MTTSLEAMLAEVEDFDDIDAAYAEVARKPYGFMWAGQRWVLPHIGELDWRVQARIESADGLTFDALNALFLDMFGPEQAPRWEQAVQPGPALEILFSRWLAHAGRKQGEEPASNDSSESTGEKSRPTSGTTTGSGSRKRSTAKKAPAKRAPRKAAAAKPTPAQLAAEAARLGVEQDAVWLAEQQALAGSPPAKS